MLSSVHPVPAKPFPLGEALAAGQGTVTVGRQEDNVVSAIRLNSAAPTQLPEKLVNMVSRQHARLEVVAGQLELVDLGSVNGTYVNDARIEASSRRVLQEGDVVSFGGPSSLAMNGRRRPNPWVWRISQLHEFLAAYVPPRQGAPPAVAVSPAHDAAAGAGAAPEVYSFSPGPAPAAQQQPAAAPSGQALPPGTILAAADEVASPDPLPGSDQLGGAALLPGCIPVEATEPLGADGSAPAAAAAAPLAPRDTSAAVSTAAVLAHDSDESAELAAMAAYEAQLASQQGSAEQPAAAAPAVPADAQAGPTQLLGHTQAGAAAAMASPLYWQRPPQQPQQQLPRRPLLPPQRLQQRPVEAEVVDLTGDSPTGSPHLPPQQQQQQGNRGQGSGGCSGGRVAAAEGAEVVDLLGSSSPTKRRHGAAGQVEQESKRARPSPEGRAPRPADAAAAEPAVGGAEGASSGLDNLRNAIPVCPVCQEYVVVAHAMNPCGHQFCGECLAGWLGKQKTECMTCREKGTGPPTRARDTDNMIEGLIQAARGLLSTDDLETRQEKKASWEAKRAELEKALAAPWERGGRGRGGRGSARGGGDGLMALIAETIMAGGPAGFGGAELGLLMGAGGNPFGGAMPGSGSGRARRMPQVVAPPPPPPNEYRVELSMEHDTARCTACSDPIGELTARVGVRPQAAAAAAAPGTRVRSGQQAGPPYRWYHLDCLPREHWLDARRRPGALTNIRGLPAPQQARVREHLHLEARRR